MAGYGAMWVALNVSPPFVAGMSSQVYVQLRGLVDFEVEIKKLRKQVRPARGLVYHGHGHDRSHDHGDDNYRRHGHANGS